MDDFHTVPKGVEDIHQRRRFAVNILDNLVAVLRAQSVDHRGEESYHLARVVACFTDFFLAQPPFFSGGGRQNLAAAGDELVVDKFTVDDGRLKLKALVLEELHRVGLLLPDVDVDRRLIADLMRQVFYEAGTDSPPAAERAGNDLVDQVLRPVRIGIDQHITKDLSLLDPDIAVSKILLYRRIVDIGRGNHEGVDIQQGIANDPLLDLRTHVLN